MKGQDSIMTKFGERANARMRELGWDQKTLSDKSGIPASSLNRYISTTEPRIDTVFRAAEALGVDPSYFTESVAMAMDPYQEIVSVVGRSRKALTPEQKTEIVKMLFSDED